MGPPGRFDEPVRTITTHSTRPARVLGENFIPASVSLDAVMLEHDSIITAQRRGLRQRACGRGPRNYETRCLHLDSLPGLPWILGVLRYLSTATIVARTSGPGYTYVDLEATLQKSLSKALIVAGLLGSVIFRSSPAYGFQTTYKGASIVRTAPFRAFGNLSGLR